MHTRLHIFPAKVGGQCHDFFGMLDAWNIWQHLIKTSIKIIILLQVVHCLSVATRVTYLSLPKFLGRFWNHLFVWLFFKIQGKIPWVKTKSKVVFNSLKLIKCNLACLKFSKIYDINTALQLKKKNCSDWCTHAAISIHMQVS